MASSIHIYRWSWRGECTSNTAHPTTECIVSIPWPQRQLEKGWQILVGPCDRNVAEQYELWVIHFDGAYLLICT